MRLALVLALLLAVAPAAGAVTPARPADAALLKRAATPDELLAQSVAARLTGKKPVVRCAPLPASSGELGVTPFMNGRPAGYFLLSQKVCADLAAFRANHSAYDLTACPDDACGGRVFEVVQAIQTIAHESYHVLGFYQEATAECYGMQSLWYAAHRLGASVALSQSLAQYYWSQIYPLRRRSHYPEYWSAECRDGGKLDLRPKSHAWPS
jgi:hypothetical protein